MIIALLTGIFLAFGLILPLGPQNVFVLNQGGQGRYFWHALPAILTASLSDTFLILMSTFGVTFFLLKHPLVEKCMLVVGIFFLLYLSISLWKTSNKKGATEALTAPRIGILRQIIFCLSVSLLNPHAILDTVLVIGSNALAFQGPSRWVFSAGCIFVSWIWFFSLAFFGKLLSKINGVKFYQDRISAVLILLGALNLLFRLLFQ